MTWLRETSGKGGWRRRGVQSVHVGGLQRMQGRWVMVERVGVGWDGYDEQCGDVMPEEYVDGICR
jgi:hypothetical protein